MRALPRLVIVLMVLGGLDTAQANPVDAFGFGARAVGMSGAMTASAEGFSASHYNPAALARDNRLRIELGYAYMHPSLRLNGQDLGVDAHRGFQGGFVLAGDLYEHTVAFALSLFLPDRLITRVRALPERQPRFVMYDNRPQRLVLSASLAVEIFEGLTVGASLSFLSHTKGRLDVSGLVGFTDPDETQLRTGVVEDLVAVRYPTIGIHYSPTQEMKLGLTFREEFALELGLEVIVRGDIVDDGATTLTDASFQMASDSQTLFSPRQLAFGWAWDTGCWQVSADITWAQWSRFPTPAATVSMSLNLPGLPITLPPPDTPVAPNFHDIFIPRIGVESGVIAHPAFELEVRGGYAYEPSPVPAQQGRTSYADTDKHSFSVGLGLTLHILESLLPEPIELDLATQFIYLPTVVTTKSDPADATGDFTADGWWVGGALTARLLF
jgi:long-chain fatty acid transport protein